MKPVSWYVKHVPGAWREAPKWNWIASWPGGPTPGVGQGRTASPAGRVRAAEATEQRLTFRLPLTSDEDGFLEPVAAELGHLVALTV